MPCIRTHIYWVFSQQNGRPLYSYPWMPHTRSVPLFTTTVLMMFLQSLLFYKTRQEKNWYFSYPSICLVSVACYWLSIYQNVNKRSKMVAPTLFHYSCILTSLEIKLAINLLTISFDNYFLSYQNLRFRSPC